MKPIFKSGDSVNIRHRCQSSFSETVGEIKFEESTLFGSPAHFEYQLSGSRSWWRESCLMPHEEWLQLKA